MADDEVAALVVDNGSGKIKNRKCQMPIFTVTVF